MLTGAVIGFILWFCIFIYACVYSHYNAPEWARKHIRVEWAGTLSRMIIFILLGASIGYLFI